MEEEDEKRRRIGGQIGFSYDDNGAADEPDLPTEGPQLPPQHLIVDDDGGDYVPDPELRIPPDVLIPPNNKVGLY